MRHQFFLLKSTEAIHHKSPVYCSF